MFGFLDTLIAAGYTWLIAFLLVLLVGGLGYIAFNFLAIRTLFQEIAKAIRDLFGLIIPTKWDSARTLILLSLFSWVTSMLVSSTIQNVIAFVGWLFLIAGVHWIMNEEKQLKEVLTINGIFIGPWITGALICYFLFATPDQIPAIAFILWPCVSAVIAGLPRFIGSDSVYKSPTWVKPKPKNRQYLVNLALVNLLLSCWIQLGFTTQNWFSEYSGLQIADFRNSSFVIRTQSNTEADSIGTDLLTRAETELKANLQGQSWAQVERWLLDFEPQIDRLEATVRQQLSATREMAYWSIDGKILPGEYNVQLFSTWNGPSADAAGYHYTTTCKISRVAPIDVAGRTSAGAAALPAVGNATVACSPTTGPITGQPEIKAQS